MAIELDCEIEKMILDIEDRWELRLVLPRNVDEKIVRRLQHYAEEKAIWGIGEGRYVRTHAHVALRILPKGQRKLGGE